MKVYTGNGLGDMYFALVREIARNGKQIPTRHGPCLELDEPVCLRYEMPGHCWMTIPGRGFNPFFALAEVMWILAGNGNVEWISYFNSNMRKFADEGKEEFHGAYGLRMRAWPSNEASYITLDQIGLAIKKLKQDSFSRQAVVSLWDPSRDNLVVSKDYPCNNLLYFRLRDGVLDQTVIQRSCDLVWGAPHNAIQFSHVHAYVAGCLGAKMGRFHYFIQNLHYYLDLYKPTLAKLICQAFDEPEMYRPTIRALAVPGFGPVTGEEFETHEDYTLHMLHVDMKYLSTAEPRGEGYWGKILPTMLWIYKMVKEQNPRSFLNGNELVATASHIARKILSLPQPLWELALMYYEDKTYGISKEVYSTCVRMLNEKEEESGTSPQAQEEESVNRGGDSIPPEEASS